MTQLIITVAAFALIPILIKLRVKLSYTILLVAAIIALLAGDGFMSLLKTSANIFIHKYSRDTVLAVVVVGMLGSLMKRYGILSKIVDSLLGLISNKKLILMIIPSMIGLLIVPGGAILSAPFINQIGEDLGIRPARRAAINLIFRHIAMFILPYSTTLLFVKAAIPEVQLGTLILFNLIFVIGAICLGYIIYLRDLPKGEVKQEKSKSKSLLDLIFYSLPVYISVILNLAFSIPFFIGLLISVFIVYLMSDKSDFIKHAIKSINLNTVLLVISVLILKDTILSLKDMMTIVESGLRSYSGGIGVVIIFTAVSLFFGFITGYPTSAMALTLPMLVMLEPKGVELYVYCYLLITTSFIGYFFSPLHMCQLLTIGEMKVTTNELYKDYKYYAPMLLVFSIISSILMLRIF